MIGFVVLFALFIWVIVTIFSMILFHKICRKIFPNYRWSGIVNVQTIWNKDLYHTGRVETDGRRGGCLEEIGAV